MYVKIYSRNDDYKKTIDTRKRNFAELWLLKNIITWEWCFYWPTEIFVIFSRSLANYPTQDVFFFSFLKNCKYKGPLALRLECSPMALETGVQSQFESYQRLKKIALDPSLLNTQHYKVSIKGKVEQSREGSRALPYTSV